MESNYDILNHVAASMIQAIDLHDRSSETRDDLPSSGERITTAILETLMGSFHKRVAYDSWLHQAIDKTRAEAMELLRQRRDDDEIWISRIESKKDYLASLTSQVETYNDMLEAMKTLYTEHTGSRWVPWDQRVAKTSTSTVSAAAYELEQMLAAAGMSVEAIEVTDTNTETEC